MVSAHTKKSSINCGSSAPGTITFQLIVVSFVEICTTFYHKGPLPSIPDSVHQLRIAKREGGTGTRVWVDDLDGLLGLVAMRAVELHTWNSTIDDLEHPD